MGNFNPNAKDQHDLLLFVRYRHAWHAKWYFFHKGGVVNRPPIFLDHILGELLNEEDEDYQENHSERSDKSKEALRNKDKKKGKKHVSFETHPENSYGVPEVNTPTKPKK